MIVGTSLIMGFFDEGCQLATLSLTILDIILNFLCPLKSPYLPYFGDIFVLDRWTQLLTRFKSVRHLAHNQWGFLNKLTEKRATTAILSQRSFLAVSFIHFKTVIIHDSSKTKTIRRQAITNCLTSWMSETWLTMFRSGRLSRTGLELPSDHPSDTTDSLGDWSLLRPWPGREQKMPQATGRNRDRPVACVGGRWNVEDNQTQKHNRQLVEINYFQHLC